MFQSLADFVSGLFGARWSRRFSRRVASRNRSPWRKRARCSREVLLPEPRETAEARVKEVTQFACDTTQRSRDRCLEALTDAGVRSNGTVIHVQLVERDDGMRVEVAAWPAAQLLDWGESRRVVDRVIASLGPSLPVEPPIAGRFR